MAGVLPGVEAARRRRFHQNNLNDGGGSTSSRRSSFCLYATNYQEFHITQLSFMERNPRRQAENCDDEELEEAVREAKKRLDHRLKTHWKSESKRKPKGRGISTIGPFTNRCVWIKVEEWIPKRLKWSHITAN